MAEVKEEEVNGRTPSLPFQVENSPQNSPAPPRVDSKDPGATLLSESSPELSPKKLGSQDQSVPSWTKSPGWSDPGTRSEDRQWSELYQQTPTLPFEEHCGPWVHKEARPSSLPTPERVAFSLDEVSLDEADHDDDATLRLFVAQLVAMLLRGCNVHRDHRREAWLTEQTMGGLAHLADGFCPPRGSAGAICDAVRTDLQQTFWSKQQLDTLVLMEHPAVDSVIVQCLQAHIRSQSAAQRAKDTQEARTMPLFWRFVPPMLVFAMVVGILWLLVIFLPS